MSRIIGLLNGVVHRPLRQTVAWGMALALPALMPIIVAAIAVSSLTLSPDTIAAGGTATATVTLDAASVPLTGVAISSSNPSVATVPPKIDLGGKLGSRGTFAVKAAGSAGCATISARTGTTAPKSATVFVQPPLSTGMLTLTLSVGSVQGGSSLTGTLKLNQPNAGPVQLSSNNPAVTVPATVTLIPNEIGIAVGTFPITTSIPTATTCAIITATFSGAQGRALLKVTRLFVG